MTFLNLNIAKPAIAASLAAAIALTPITATPARADNEEYGALAAAGVLALIIGGIIASQDSGRATVTTAPRGPRGPVVHPRGPRGPRAPVVQPRHDPKPRHDRVLPAQCKFTVMKGPSRGQYVDRDCLKRNFRDWTYLPMRCEVNVKRRGERSRIAYKVNCLARNGYRSDADVAGTFRTRR